MTCKYLYNNHCIFGHSFCYNNENEKTCYKVKDYETFKYVLKLVKNKHKDRELGFEKYSKDYRGLDNIEAERINTKCEYETFEGCLEANEK